MVGGEKSYENNFLQLTPDGLLHVAVKVFISYLMEIIISGIFAKGFVFL